MRTILIATAAGLLCLQTVATACGEERAVIKPRETWADVLSGSEVKFHYAVRAKQAFDGRLEWSLSVNRRTVEHGQLPLTVQAEHPAEAAFAFKAPEVKEGVILESQLSVAAYAAGDEKAAAGHVKKVWIFPPDPFADRTQWLKGLKITLFDPERKTADVLEKAGVPFMFTKNPSALDELNEGLLVIGEGISWKDYRGLGESMVRAAARGVPVLCLAPGEGSLVLPGSEGTELPRPVGLTLRHDDIISELDKRLDAAGWPPEGKIDACRLAIKSDRDQVVAEVAQEGRGWPWLEARYAAPRGKLLVCGFGIMRHWEATPAPRYLLSELFLRLSAEEQQTPSSQEERKD